MQCGVVLLIPFRLKEIYFSVNSIGVLGKKYATA